MRIRSVRSPTLIGRTRLDFSGYPQAVSHKLEAISFTTEGTEKCIAAIPSDVRPDMTWNNELRRKKERTSTECQIVLPARHVLLAQEAELGSVSRRRETTREAASFAVLSHPEAIGAT